MSNPITYLTAGSVVGPSHVEKGLPNQDSFRVHEGENYTLMVVADGAGSLERSDEGSMIVVESALAVATEILDGDLYYDDSTPLEKIAVNSLVSARDTLMQLDFWSIAGCTFTIAIIREDDFFIGGIGDSFAVAEMINGTTHLIQPPAAGEFVNITKLITSKDLEFSGLEGKTRDLRSVALCSDAFEQATIKNGEAHAGFWTNLFEIARKRDLSIEELITFMTNQELIDDDATMIVGTTDSQASSCVGQHFSVLYDSAHLDAIVARGLDNLDIMNDDME